MSSHKATARDLIGRTIISVDFCRFDNGRGGKATDPVLTLDTGQRVWFSTQETESSGYGTSILIDNKGGQR